MRRLQTQFEYVEIPNQTHNNANSFHLIRQHLTDNFAQESQPFSKNSSLNRPFPQFSQVSDNKMNQS
jgi:hypothetical protein